MYQPTTPPDLLCHWYVVHCQSGKEWQAASALESSLDLTAYLPLVKQQFRKKQQYAPLFPRYLFLHVDLGRTALSKINATPGVLRVVMFDNIPQPIPTGTMQAIRQRVDMLNAQGGLVEHHFHPGDPVYIKNGPLQGLEAVFIGSMKASERVRVLIDFLGELRKAEVHADMIEPMHAVPPKRERRTRGKGRRIMAQRSHDDHLGTT